MSSEDSEYGKMTFIYISETDRRRLEGDERLGKWYDPIACGAEPSVGRPVKTRVPEDAVTHGVFHPDRYEPELVLEWCETVTVNPPRGAAPLRKGDRVRQTLHGPGAIVTEGYAAGMVAKIAGGRAYVHWDGSEDRFAPNVYDPATGHEIDPPIPGFASRIARLEIAPERAERRKTAGKKSDRTRKKKRKS